MLNVGGFRGAYLVKHRRSDDGIDIVDIDITGDIIDIDIDIVDNNPIDIGPHHHGCHDYDDRGAGCDDSAAGTSGRDTDHRAGHDVPGAAPIGDSGL